MPTDFVNLADPLGRQASTGGCCSDSVDKAAPSAYGPRLVRALESRVMKVVNSLKSAKLRHKDCRVIRRKGRVYVINKTNPRFKARQG